MSISLSTNLLLVDASAKAGTIILPNPSTLAGRILYIRDVAGTINRHSTVSLVTATTHVSVATMFLPSSFITLAAAPIGNIQYHVIGGQYFEYFRPGQLYASTIYADQFISDWQSYSNTVESLSSVNSIFVQFETYSTTKFTTSNLIMGENFTLGASNGKLTVNNAGWQGKNFAIQSLNAFTDPTFPYKFINANATFPLYWFDGKDSNTMYTGLQTNTKVAPGGKVVRWNSKPSTLQLFAWNQPNADCGTYTDSSGVYFPTNGGFGICNLDPNYALYPYALPLTTETTIYLVATKALGGGTGTVYFGRPFQPFPYIFTNVAVTSLYSNGNLSTPVTTASNASGWVGGATEVFPMCLDSDSGFNMFTIKKSVVQPNPTLEIYYNGSNIYKGYSTEDLPGNSYNYLRQYTVLGDYNMGTGEHIGPTAYYGDLLFYNNTVHTRPQQQEIEGWLAARWNIRNKLPLTHPYYSASN